LIILLTTTTEAEPDRIKLFCAKRRTGNIKQSPDEIRRGKEEDWTKKDATIDVQSVRDGKNTVDAMSKTEISKYARRTPKKKKETSNGIC
jgi:hypothetical protein